MYGHPATDIHLEDRALAHLQIVFSDKLRRNEAFHFTWADAPTEGGGRNIIWVHPTMPIYFRYSGSRPPSINRAWLDELEHSANNGGLVLRDEPAGRSS